MEPLLDPIVQTSCTVPIIVSKLLQGVNLCDNGRNDGRVLLCPRFAVVNPRPDRVALTQVYYQIVNTVDITKKSRYWRLFNQKSVNAIPPIPVIPPFPTILQISLILLILARSVEKVMIGQAEDHRYLPRDHFQGEN